MKKRKGLGLWALWVIPFLFIFAILFWFSESSKEYKYYRKEEEKKK